MFLANISQDLHLQIVAVQWNGDTVRRNAFTDVSESVSRSAIQLRLNTLLVYDNILDIVNKRRQ